MKDIVFILLLGCSIGIAYPDPDLKESNGSGNYTLTVLHDDEWIGCLQKTVDYVKYPRVGFSINPRRWWLELIFRMDGKTEYSPDIYFVTANGPNQPRIRCYSMKTSPSRLCWIDGDPSNYNKGGSLILNINRIEPLSLTFWSADVENMKIFRLSVPYALLQNSCHFTEDYDNFKVTLIINMEHGTWTIKVSGFVKHFPDGLKIINQNSKQQFSCDNIVIISGFKLRACEVIGRVDQLPKKGALVLEFAGENTGTPFTTLLRSERVKNLSEEDSSEILLRSEQITFNPEKELGLTVIKEDEKKMKILTLNVPDALLKDDCFITEEHGDLMVSFIRSIEDWIWIIIITGFEKDFPQGFEIIKVNHGTSKLRFNCNIYVVRFGHESRSCELIGSYKDLPKEDKIGVRLPLAIEFSGKIPETPPTTTLLKTGPLNEHSKEKTTEFFALMASKRPGRKDLPEKNAPTVKKSLVAESKGENIGNPTTSLLQRKSSPSIPKKEELSVTVENEGDKNMKTVTLSVPGDLLQKDGVTQKNHGGMIFIYGRNNKEWSWVVIIAGFEKYFPRGFQIINNPQIKLKIDCKKSLFVYGVFFGRSRRACEMVGSYGDLPENKKPLILKFKGDNTGTPFNMLPRSETQY